MNKYLTYILSTDMYVYLLLNSSHILEYVDLHVCLQKLCVVATVINGAL